IPTGLDEEDVGASDRLAVAAVGLAVRKRADLDLTELHAELPGDPRRQLGMRAAREHHEPLRVAALQPVVRLRLRLNRLHLETRQARLSRSRRGACHRPSLPW